ncbi:MAG TPA: HAD-IB family hydrolase [Peptococcaceae bacterium]|nr:HAD-IB family hydrolase [Peptococcaceae bacterium]
MKLAIFDFDGTLFLKDTLPFLLSRWKYLKCSRFTLYKTVLSLLPLFVKYKLENASKLSREEIKLQAVRKFNRLFYGRSEQELREYFETCAMEIAGLLNENVVAEVEKAKADGFHTVLLSGAYHYLLKNVGDYLGFDTVIGSEMHFKDGLYDHMSEFQPIIGDIKMSKIQEVFGNKDVDWQASRAYADSYSDLGLLLKVGNPVAVRPDSMLKEVAEEKKWRIIT